MNKQLSARFKVTGMTGNGRNHISTRARLHRLLQVWLAALMTALLLAHSAGLKAAGSPTTVATTEPRTANSAKPLSHRDAIHFLGRAGIGTHPGEVLRYAGLTRQQAVQQLLDGIQASPDSAMPAWVDASSPAYLTRSSMLPEERRAFNHQRNLEFEDLRNWWIGEMIQTSSPQTERLVLFWHNHFVTAYSAINNQSTSMARQNRLFREHAAGNFGEFLKAVLRDPAMLEYLDNRSNHKKAPNENLARELLELFTLGEGNYSEADVKNAARALTGYSVAPAHNMGFRFMPHRHDFDQKSLFGNEGSYNGDDLVDLILDQPATARHVTRKFWREYVSSTSINESAVNAIATEFQASGYEISALLRALLLHPEFWSQANRHSVIKSPVDIVVGTLRTRGHTIGDPSMFANAMKLQGQALFEPPNVAGWSGGETWITPDRLLSRITWLSGFGDESKTVSQNSSAGSAMDNGQSMNAAAENTGMMSEQGSGMAMSAASTASTMGMDSAGSDRDRQQVSARLASDDFEGTPEVRIELLDQGKVVWQSSVLTLDPGRDTEQNGLREAAAGFGWKKYRFDAGSAETGQMLAQAPLDFDAVRIHFLNDHAGATGDRNLYVSWVKVNDLLLPSHRGNQSSFCSPKSSYDAGLLYCSGYIEFNMASMDMSPGDLSVHEPPEIDHEGLVIDKVYFTRAQNPELHHQKAKRKQADLVLALTDMQFGERYWENFQAVVKVSENKHADRGHHFALVFDRYGCWPDCLDEWPDCARTSEHDEYFRSVWLELEAPAAIAHAPAPRHCQLDDLNPDDQALAVALWDVFPQLLNALDDDRRLNRERQLVNFKKWQPLITQLAAKAPKSMSASGPEADKNRDIRVAVSRHQYESALIDKMNHYQAAGQPVSVWQQSAAGLLETAGDDKTLRALFAPVNVGQSMQMLQPNHKQSANDLRAFLKTPAYQLK